MLFEPYCRRHGIVVPGGLSESRRRLLCTDSRGGRKRHDLFSFFIGRRNPSRGLAAGKFIRSPSSVKPTDFFCPAVLFFRRINNSQHRLGAGMKMQMLHSDRLLMVAPMLVERFYQLKLKPEQSSTIAAPNADVSFIQVKLTQL